MKEKIFEEENEWTKVHDEFGNSEVWSAGMRMRGERVKELAGALVKVVFIMSYDSVRGVRAMFTEIHVVKSKRDLVE